MADDEYSDDELAALVADLSAEIEREPDAIEQELAKLPEYGDAFEFEGLSQADAFKHPTIGPALEAFHDRLYWSKNLPETGAGGMEIFGLALIAANAGHPLRKMPPPRRAAKLVKATVDRMLAPAYLAAMRGRNRGGFVSLLPPVLWADTIHGSRTLLDNAREVRLKITGAWRSRSGDVQFEDYAGPAMRKVMRAANRYDPEHPSQAKFTTFINDHIDFALVDWQTGKGNRTDSLDEMAEQYEVGSALDVMDILGLGGAVPSPDYFVPDRRWPPEMRRRVWTEANLTRREQTVFENALSERRTSKQLCEDLGVSPGNLYLITHRMRRKVAPVLGNMLFKNKH